MTSGACAETPSTAYPVLLLGASLAMFGSVDLNQGAGIIAFVPGGLFELLLPIGLFVKGFNSSAIDPGSAKTNMNEIR